MPRDYVITKYHIVCDNLQISFPQDKMHLITNGKITEITTN